MMNETICEEVMNGDELSSDDEMALLPAQPQLPSSSPSAGMGLTADELARLKAMLMAKARQGNLQAIRLILQLMRTPWVKPPPSDFEDFSAEFANFVKPLESPLESPLVPSTVRGSVDERCEAVRVPARPGVVRDERQPLRPSAAFARGSRFFQTCSAWPALGHVGADPIGEVDFWFPYRFRRRVSWPIPTPAVFATSKPSEDGVADTTEHLQPDEMASADSAAAPAFVPATVDFLPIDPAAENWGVVSALRGTVKEIWPMALRVTLFLVVLFPIVYMIALPVFILGFVAMGALQNAGGSIWFVDVTVWLVWGSCAAIVLMVGYRLIARSALKRRRGYLPLRPPGAPSIVPYFFRAGMVPMLIVIAVTIAGTAGICHLIDTATANVEGFSFSYVIWETGIGYAVGLLGFAVWMILYGFWPFVEADRPGDRCAAQLQLLGTAMRSARRPLAALMAIYTAGALVLAYGLEVLDWVMPFATSDVKFYFTLPLIAAQVVWIGWLIAAVAWMYHQISGPLRSPGYGFAMASPPPAELMPIYGVMPPMPGTPLMPGVEAADPAGVNPPSDGNVAPD